jgi:two-component system, OmpR family, heavy metal sensor histidine kinase CusS
MSRNRSVTGRLTAFFAVSAAIILLAAGSLISFSLERHFDEQDRVALGTGLQLMRDALSSVRSMQEFDVLAGKLGPALLERLGFSAAVISPDGRTVFVTPGAVFPESMFNDARTATDDGLSAPVTWKHGGHTLRGIAATASAAIPETPPAVVALALDIEPHVQFMKAFRRTLWLAVGLGIPLCVLLGWAAARRGLAPLRRVVTTAQGITASSLTERLSLDGVPTELTELVKAFNGMLARLEESFRRLSHFSDDIAHELRTPIANILAQTEVALSRPRSAEQYRDALYANLEVMDRLARMASDMLYLAKADNGLLVPRQERVDVETEVAELLDFYSALAEEQGVRLERSGQGVLWGERLMARRAIGNLLSNAIRHAPRGGEVHVDIEQDAGKAVRIGVSNTGAEIPAEHLERLFERFYRAELPEEDRTEGTGLGLAITKAIAEAHGGRISASSQRGVTLFELSFPAPASPKLKVTKT